MPKINSGFFVFVAIALLTLTTACETKDKEAQTNNHSQIKAATRAVFLLI